MINPYIKKRFSIFKKMSLIIACLFLILDMIDLAFAVFQPLSYAFSMSEKLWQYKAQQNFILYQIFFILLDLLGVFLSIPHFEFRYKKKCIIIYWVLYISYCIVSTYYKIFTNY